MIWINVSRRQVMRVFLLLAGVALATSFICQELHVEAEIEPYFFSDSPALNVALTFEISWEEGNLEQILSVLEKEKTPATFFLTGTWIERFPDKANAIKKYGHEIGCHSYSHTSFLYLSGEEISQELNKFKDTAWKNLKIRPRLLRPPLGEYNAFTMNIANDLGYRTVLWSVESYDYLARDTGDIVQRIEEKLHCGAIINFRTSAEQLPKALGPVIRLIRHKGYKIVTVSQLIDGNNLKKN